MTLVEEWVVRHDAAPRQVEFTYTTAEEAAAAFETSGFYDPATGWGVTLLRRVRGQEILATTKSTAAPSDRSIDHG